MLRLLQGDVGSGKTVVAALAMAAAAEAGVIRVARRAGWPAINSGRCDRIPEMAIGRSVGGYNAGPARVIGHVCFGGIVFVFEGRSRHVVSIRHI